MAWDRDHLKGLNPAKALAVKLVSPVEAAIAAIVHGHRPGWLPVGSTPNNQFPVAAALNFGDVSLNLGIVKSAADLLAGATDADGDALTVASVTVGVGCTVTGTGPWTITPTAEGAGTANVTISDGRGGTVVRVLSWTCFNPGLWNHAAAVASGGSQILGPNRYRIYSAAGAISQVTVPGALVVGRAYQFQLTFETPVLGTQLQVGDAGANLDDFISSLAGTRTVAFVADGTVATLKRPYVVSAGVPTDVVVKNVAVTDITATALNITSQPQARSIVDGNTTTFSVTVAAPFSAIHYSWEVSTNGGSTWATYVGGTGATTNTLTTAAMTLGDNGELFRCRIRMGSATNTIGQIYSNAATLTVTAANANPVAPTLALGDLTVGTGLVLSSTDLLAGATDADGDTLTITSVTAVSGGTVSGTGPWTITPSATGAGSAIVVISDGRGGTVNRTATWNGVAAPAIPTISGVTGTIAHGQTITVTGTGLGQAPTLLRIAGDEGAVGTSVAAATGMTVHGTTGNEWLFEAGGTMVLDMQAAAPKTVYKWFGGTAYKDVFIYYERQHFDVGAVNSAGNGQIKEMRCAGSDAAGEHFDTPALGTGWNAEYSQMWRYHGTVEDSSELNVNGATRAVMTAWSSQIVAGRIVSGQTIGSFETLADGWKVDTQDHVGTADDDKGWGQVFLPFYRSPDFATSMRMRNVIVLAGRQRLEIGNNPDRASCNRVVVQYATSASATSATLQLDLTRFSANDGLYLFAVNANDEYSAANQLREPTVPDNYNPLTDNYGVIRPTFNGGTGLVTTHDYSAEAMAADSLRFRIGFTITALDSAVAGTPIGVVLSSHSSAYRGYLRIDHVTGNVTIISMTNNTNLTIAAGTNFHTALGVRRDWELVVPKATGGLITLTDKQTGTLIGSVARTAAFDGYYPRRWMYGNTLSAGGSLKGGMAYLQCFATTGGVESTLFDFRFTAEQAGLTSVPSAHDTGVIATIGSALTWGAV